MTIREGKEFDVIVAGAGCAGFCAAVQAGRGGLNVALFEQAGVFSEEAPHVIGLQSDVLDKKTFLNFLAHAVYYSDQPFAKAISDYYNQEYKLEI